MLHPRLHRFTHAEFMKMVSVGILYEGSRIDLIDGLLFDGSRLTPPNCYSISCVLHALEELPLVGWYVKRPMAFVVGNSQPMPVVGVVRGKLGDYSKRHPTPEEVGLVVEVSDLSLEFDRTVKSRFYGASGIPLYWIVNLIDRQVEVMTQPTPTGYDHATIYRPGDAVPLALDGSGVGSIAVNDLLPRREGRE